MAKPAVEYATDYGTVEYATEGKLFNTDTDYGTERISWYNALGAEGWEIFKVQSSFNRDYTTLQEYVTMRRRVEAH